MEAAGQLAALALGRGSPVVGPGQAGPVIAPLRVVLRHAARATPLLAVTAVVVVLFLVVVVVLRQLLQ